MWHQTAISWWERGSLRPWRGAKPQTASIPYRKPTRKPATLAPARGYSLATAAQSEPQGRGGGWWSRRPADDQEESEAPHRINMNWKPIAYRKEGQVWMRHWCTFDDTRRVVYLEAVQQGLSMAGDSGGVRP